ncbi:MAG TPA: hypothetical protein P5515_06640, partial [Methanolinea sp.]|nr:hypothetical protein [Methanolinea sp.]
MEVTNRGTIHPSGKRGASPRISGSGKSLIISWLVVAMVLAMVALPACSAAPPPFARLDLNQTQTYRNLTISSLETVDLMDLSVSRVTLHSTVGDDSDTKTIPFPGIRDIRRVFSSDTASWHGNTLTILGGTDTTVPGAGFEEYTLFKAIKVPVVQVNVTDDVRGDVFLSRTVTSHIPIKLNITEMFKNTDRLYILHEDGVLGLEILPNGSIGKKAIINVDPDDFKEYDLGHTLIKNENGLADFFFDRTIAQLISASSTVIPKSGNFILSAFQYLPGSPGKIVTYAAWPVIILEDDNPLDISSHIYDKRSGSDLTLTFQNPAPVKNITYLLVKDDET